MAAKGQGRTCGPKGDARKGGDTFDAEIDALFQLPPGAFTAARNALAARLKKGGRADAAEQVRSLARPSVTAWAVNHLYWRHRAAFARLLEAGEAFRAAQAAQLSGKSTELRAPLEARRAALAGMAKLAAGVLREGGSSATPENMRRITTTLEALSTYGSLPEAPRPGRLQDDVEPPGFETLAALVPRVGDGGGRSAGPTHILPFQQKQRPARRGKGKASPEDEARRAEEERRARKAAVQEAERELRDARKAAQQAEERLKKAAARAKEAEQAKADAEQRLEKATADADAARQEARRVAAEAEEAAQALQDAERALEKATSG